MRSESYTHTVTKNNERDRAIRFVARYLADPDLYADNVSLIDQGFWE